MRQIQFFYGERSAITYQMNDRLLFDSFYIGEPLASATMPGIARLPCPMCGFDNEEYYWVHIEGSVLPPVITWVCRAIRKASLSAGSMWDFLRSLGSRLKRAL